MTEDQLLELGQNYAKYRGLTLSTVACYAGLGRAFDRLSDGHSVTLRTARRIVQWFSDHWPDDLEWPRNIVRPAAQKEAA